jgi:hypothetical protein
VCTLDDSANDQSTQLRDAADAPSQPSISTACLAAPTVVKVPPADTGADVPVKSTSGSQVSTCAPGPSESSGSGKVSLEQSERPKTTDTIDKKEADSSLLHESSAPKAESGGQAEGTSEQVVLNPAPKKAGGLAARRKLGLSMATHFNASDAKQSNGAEQTGTSVVFEKIGKKAIKRIDSFRDLYTLGEEVMPSSNTGMEVIFAKRKSDNAEMVIKTREKSSSFISKEEESDWRKSTEMILNLPKSESIAQIYEVLEDSRTYYVIMEKVHGMDLFELLNSEGRQSTLEAKVILRQLLTAVNDLHLRGCIHKDIKLENVMADRLTPKTAKSRQVRWDEPHSPTTVKLIDFDTVETFSETTLAKSVVGTDQYIAPEAYVGHYSPASDIFSVGVIAYRLISGRFPFKEAMFDDEPGENWVGSPKMKVIHDRLMHFKINFRQPPWPTEPEARELVEWMLSSVEKGRPTAQQCLDHRFFNVTGFSPKMPKSPWSKR